MKKSLLALAALSTLAAAGTSFAQTNVTIYGIVDAGLVRDIHGTAGTSTRLDSGLQNGSRLGFKGTEDLGGGLSAIFTLESGFNIDTGVSGQQGQLFGRQAWVGVNGGFGTVKLGRQTTVVYNNSGTFDPFGDTLAGDSARLFNYNGSRSNNTISYAINQAGFRGEIDYGFGEVAGNTKANRYAAAALGYANGPIDVIVTHSRQTDATDANVAKTTLVGANYNFGIVKLYGAYAWNKGSGGPNTTTNTTTTTDAFIGRDSRDALIGLSAPVGPAGTIMTSYIRKKDRQFANSDTNQIALGYSYNLSSRTALYTSFARVANDGAVARLTDAPGQTEKLYNVGVRHKF
jgi:predicted porin